MNVAGLQALHTLANIFGIIPSFNLNQNEAIIKTHQVLDQLRGATFITFFVCINTYSVYGKAFVFGKYIHKAVLGTYTLTEMIGTVINILCIYHLNLRSGEKLLSFLRKLQRLEKFIPRTKDVGKEKKTFLIEFGVMTLLGILFACLSCYVYWTQLGWEVYKYFALRETQNIHTLVLLEIVTRYPKLIEMRLKELNEHLKTSVFHGRIVWTPSIGVLNGTNQTFTIKAISEGYTAIVELIQEFNMLFGSICFLFCSNIVFNILVPVNMALLFMQGTPIHSVKLFGPSFIVFCVFWVLFPCIFGLKLFAVCDEIAKEIEKVPYVCYSLIQTLGDGEFKLKKELEEYANQTDRMKAKFTAAGFFDINLELTLPILGSVFTYIIVLMQFHSM